MGAKVSKQHEYIVPQENHMHIFSDSMYVSDEESGFVLSKKIGKAGDFKIKDTLGKKLFDVIGTESRFSNERIILNEDGSLLIIRKKPIGFFGKTYNVFSPHNSCEPLVTIHSHFKIAMTRLSVKVHDMNTNIKFKIVLQGDFLNRSAHIYKGNPNDNGEPIGILKKSLSLKSIISKEYTIVISAGIDQLLMIALALIFDEIHTETDNNKKSKKTRFTLEI